MKTIWKGDPLVQKLVRPRAAVEGQVYRASQFALPFEVDGRFFLFHTLTRQCVELPAPASLSPFRFDPSESGEALAELVRRRFFVPEAQDEYALYEGAMRLLRNLRVGKPCSLYTILPTTACNARCIYCFEQGFTPVTMDPGTVGDVIAFIRATRDPDRPVRLSWFGGEPLLCASIIDRICHALAESGVAFESTMVTNGSLIDARAIAHMKETWHLKAVQLSMDCAEEEYIHRKNYYRYRDEYHAVMRSAGLLAGSGIDTVIRCNVDEANLKDMPAFIDDLEAEIPNRSSVWVYFLPLYGVQTRPSAQAVWTACADAERLAASRGFRVRSGIDVRRLKQSYCMAEKPGEAVVIAPDGKLYRCEHCPAGSEIGHVREGAKALARLKAPADLEPAREKCRECCLLPECMTYTGCPVRPAVCTAQRRAWLIQALVDEIARTDPLSDAPDGEAIESTC